MNIKEIIKTYDNPIPYVRGTHMMWTDEHISKKLLEIHLNPDIGAASRIASDIDKTVDMIDKMIKPGSEILDLGCGPGLYTERLSQRGHRVTGVDFSRNSIEYAIKRSEKNNLNIRYINDNYLKMCFDKQFDFIMMIYCDFGVIVPDERSFLIKNIYKALKPGGTFLFDAIDEGTIERINLSQSWEMSENGFWKSDPYICLSKNYIFKECKATLDQHIVIAEDDSFKLYRFWNHYFDQNDVEKIFIPNGFSKVESVRNVLTCNGPYNDHGVVFYSVSN